MEPIHVQVWVVSLVWGLLLSIIIYVWRSLVERVKKIERSEEEMLKKKAAEGVALTIITHDVICGKVHEQFEKTLVEKLDLMEKTFALMIENAILKALRDYDLGQGFKGKQGIQGIQGVKGDKGDQG